ncbi:la related protein 7 [Lycorma delicatula]|uniref:la related protein 7 n=1 Tax=Lycorma delicatula TaxID=130591 RepID=UPI003F519643
MGEETEKPANKIGVMATVSKKPRHRKKLLYQEIKKQMEFYFGDVNISKDRFMNELLQESPYIPISVFLRFNKIKAMTSKEKDIAKALQTSELLKVTECGTKVYRISAPQIKNNPDDCTIYVEQLPLDADHNWLTDIFQPYGPVDYVSIPKFKRSHKNKGFAFIEFKDPQSAKNALAAFSDMGCCLSSLMDPGNLRSIKTFEENENEITNKNQTQENQQDDTVSNCINKIGEDKNSQGRAGNESELFANDNSENGKETNQRKRKLSYNPDDANDDNKRRATDVELNKDGEVKSNDDYVKETENECLKRERKLSKSDGLPTSSVMCKEDREEDEMNNGGEVEESINKVSRINGEPSGTSTIELDESDKVVDSTEQELLEENVDEEIDEDISSDDKRKKNRKRRKKHRRNKNSDISFGLQILSKSEWKSLRNKYLNEQRRKMKQLKQYLKYKKYSNYKNGKCDDSNNMENTDQTVMNPFDDKNATDSQFEISNRLKLSHGQIVKVILPEPLVNKSSFQNEAKLFPEIKYIDVKEGSITAYLRFPTSSAAEKCVESGHWANAFVIEGNEEKSYWNKIVQEREEKLSKGRLIKKGRDKLLKKAEEMHVKHIWFD